MLSTICAKKFLTVALLIGNTDVGNKGLGWHKNTTRI